MCQPQARLFIWMNFLLNFFLKTGPMVVGVAPREASDRLFIFQNRFDSLNRKYLTYNSGEELFGLSVTDYPELLSIK